MWKTLDIISHFKNYSSYVQWHYFMNTAIISGTTAPNLMNVDLLAHFLHSMVLNFQ